MNFLVQRSQNDHISREIIDIMQEIINILFRLIDMIREMIDIRREMIDNFPGQTKTAPVDLTEAVCHLNNSL